MKLRSNGPKMLPFVSIHVQPLVSVYKREDVYLFFGQLGDVVHSGVRLNLGIKMIDDGP